jgi:hypothetical protein
MFFHSRHYKKSAMTDLLQIKLANQLPLNRAAKKFLPEDWQDNQELHVLALMRWGLENGVEYKPHSPDHPTQEKLEARLNRLAQIKPNRALKFLTMAEGEVVLDAESLQKQENPQEAASLLLQTLHGNMVATAP